MVRENTNVARFLWRAAADHGGANAIVEAHGSTTYAELLGRAAAVARVLRDLDAAARGPVAVLLPRGRDAAAALFGCYASGAVPVLVDESFRPRQIEHILGQAGTRLLISTAGLLQRQPRPVRAEMPMVDLDDCEAGPADPEEPVARGCDDLAQIVYTSGSTGAPKGVMISHGNLAAATRTVTGYLEITAEDRIASLLPFSFVYGLSQLLCAVGTGATLVVETSPVPQSIAQAIRSHDVSVLAAVPWLWKRLLRAPAFREGPIPSLRIMTNAGGHLPVPEVRLLRQTQPHARLFLMYGMTETLRSTFLSPEEVDRRPDSLGRPIPGAEVMVLKEDGTPAAAGEVGELAHAGPTVALGYWRDPALTAQVFRPHPAGTGGNGRDRVAYTGDLVRSDAEGFLYFVGRKDRLMKIMGYRVSPNEVAELLWASGEVTDVAVLGEPDELLGTRIVAHVVLRPGGCVDLLWTFCTREAPRHLRPSRIEVYDELPVLSNGKPDLVTLAREAFTA